MNLIHFFTSTFLFLFLFSFFFPLLLFEMMLQVAWLGFKLTMKGDEFEFLLLLSPLPKCFLPVYQLTHSLTCLRKAMKRCLDWKS